MSTPAVYTPGQAVQGAVVQPSAVTGPKPAAVHGLAQVLKEMVHGLPAVFHTENDQLAAANAIDDYVNAHVTQNDLRGIDTSEVRAPVEDVSKRVAPNQTAYVVPQNVPAIDYDRLAEAMFRVQQANAQQAAPPPAAPEVPIPEAPLS